METFVIGLVLVAFCNFLPSQAGDESVANPCTPGDTGKYAHPNECQLFFDCAKDGDMPYIGKNVDECPYPQLFDARTNACRDFHGVECGSRSVMFNGCEYRKNENMCYHATAHCRPCLDVDYPRCEGLPDGKNPIPEMLNSPFYAVCDSDRFILQEKCPEDALGQIMLFHPGVRKCLKRENFVSVQKK